MINVFSVDAVIVDRQGARSPARVVISVWNLETYNRRFEERDVFEASVCFEIRSSTWCHFENGIGLLDSGLEMGLEWILKRLESAGYNALLSIDGQGISLSDFDCIYRGVPEA